MDKLMAQEKERILQYLDEQLEIKIDALKRYELPIQEMKDKSVQEIEAFQLRHDIYELKRHIQVIKML